MSIESEILRIQHNVANAYAAVSEKGGEVPLQPTSANLAEAVASIPAGSSITPGDGLSLEGDTLSVDIPVRDLTQDEYDALPEEQKGKGLIFLPDDADGDDSGSDGSGGEVYDGQERVIGTWFGKPLYRRIITARIPSGTGEFAVGEEIPDVDIVAELRGSMLLTNGYWSEYPYITSAGGYAVVQFNTAANKLHFYCSHTVFSNATLYAEIKYTKTTDPEVSA